MSNWSNLFQRKWNLSCKGLALVSALLAIELLFIGTLTALLHQAEHEIWLESHANAVLARINSLSQLFYEAGSLVATYSFTKNPMFKDRYQQVVIQIPQELQSLARLYTDSPQDQAKVLELQSSTNNVLKLLEKTRALVEERDKPLMFIRMSDLATELKSSVNKTTPLLAQLAAEQKHIEEGAPEEAARSRYRVQSCITVGVVLNLLLAVLMGLSFVRGITSRLNVLEDNTARLSKHEPLNSPLDGEDEIARLDRTFHSMAQKLKESEQMKQDFLSMISHDLRSPLGTIQGSLSLMSDGVYGEPTEQMKQVVDRLERNTTSMLNMINDLLDIDKFEAGMWQMEKAPASIVEIIERSIGTISTLAERKDIIIETNASDMTLQVDSERLIRVIVNLLSNAIKFSPKASIIKVSTETKSGWLELRVSDQGRGIPADALEKVFDRFEQVSIDDSKLKGGSGLGLAICKAIIEAHDGTIGVESEPGKGATFWFKIPCAVELSASSTVQSGQSVP